MEKRKEDERIGKERRGKERRGEEIGNNFICSFRWIDPSGLPLLDCKRESH